MKRVSAAAGEYTLSAAFSGVDNPDGEELVLVSVDALAPRIPSPGELQRGYRLSLREAEIAHAIASGQTTPQTHIRSESASIRPAGILSVSS